MPADLGISVGTELFKLAAPVLGAYFDDEANEYIKLEEGSSLFSEIATHLVYNLNGEKLVALVDLLLPDLYHGSQKCNWREEFSADYYELVAILEFSLKENFGSFFTKLCKAKGLQIPTWATLQAKAQTQLKSKEELNESPQ